MAESTQTNGAGRMLVIGGGISGLTVAVEAAETGAQVVLVEQEPYLGGRVARLHNYFPKMCPPYCGLEINFRRVRQNPNIEVHTCTELEALEGSPGAWKAKLKVRARKVNSNCTACGKCEEVCPVERVDAFNEGLGTTKGIYLPHAMAFPQRYVIDGANCKLEDCKLCVSACEYDAIDLEEQDKTLEVDAAMVVFATGWKPYDAAQIDNLKYAGNPDILTNVQFERLAAPNGPTSGALKRPSDGREVKRVAFVQCAGSRDRKHLPYCSAVCCSASLKQSLYVADRVPDAQVSVHYIDLRAMGKLEDFLRDKVQSRENVSLIKGKVADVEVDPATGDLVVVAEDVAAGTLRRTPVDLVVLATGIQPALNGAKLPMVRDEYGFLNDDEADGWVVAGCARRPMDVANSIRHATGAALKAIQSTRS